MSVCVCVCDCVSAIIQLSCRHTVNKRCCCPKYVYQRVRWYVSFNSISTRANTIFHQIMCYVLNTDQENAVLMRQNKTQKNFNIMITCLHPEVSPSFSARMIAMCRIIDLINQSINFYSREEYVCQEPWTKKPILFVSISSRNFEIFLLFHKI